MFVSRSTVKTHLAHVYAKLSIATRSPLERSSPPRLSADSDKAERPVVRPD